MTKCTSRKKAHQKCVYKTCLCRIHLHLLSTTPSKLESARIYLCFFRRHIYTANDVWRFKRLGEDDAYSSFEKKQVQRHSSLFFFSLDCICLDSLDLKSLQQPSILSISCLYLKMPWGYGLCLSQLTLQEKGTGVLYMALGEAQAIAP